MIDPNNIINYNRTEAELQELLLFLVCVAGKTAKTVARQLDTFLKCGEGTKFSKPFDMIKMLDKSSFLENSLKIVRFGQYTKLTKAFRELAYSELNLRTCSLEDLMSIHGIGRKSASCFLAWTRKGVKVAMLDTHLLKFLAHLKVLHQKTRSVTVLDDRYTLLLELLESVEIPKSTPSSKKLYDTLERAYLLECELKEQDPTERDLEIWRHYSKS